MTWHICHVVSAIHRLRSFCNLALAVVGAVVRLCSEGLWAVDHGWWRWWLLPREVMGQDRFTVMVVNNNKSTKQASANTDAWFGCS